jgi:hypothetical protein
MYTWSNKQRNPTLERLVRMLVTRTRENLFPLGMVHKIARNKYDHNPLILKLNNGHVNPLRDFRYELYWKNEEDFFG